MKTNALRRAQPASQHNIRELIALAAEGLIPMFDSETQLFCDRMISTENGLVQKGFSYRYTIIVLLGLCRLREARQPVPFDIQLPIERLLKETSWLDNLGDLGLLLWLCALASPDRLPELCLQHSLASAIERYPDGREQRTMELSWFLTGLSYAVLAQPKPCEYLTDVASSVFSVLKKNQGRHGVFCHQGSGSFSGLLRGRVGSFADQVYPIYAMSLYSRAFQNEESINMACHCSEAICRAQGPLGQWWWHYDSKTGGAVGKYPVYSVHQHGMAPMALFAISSASQRDFSDAIYRGLNWIYGANELSTHMRDIQRKVIWRCMRTTNSHRYLAEGLSMLKLRTDRESYQDLHILYECWPYELGWLLYAFAHQRVSSGGMGPR